MRKIPPIFTLFTFFCIPILAIAQTDKKIDSLYSELRFAKEDTNKVNILVEIGRRYEQLADYSQSRSIANEGILLAEKIDFKKGKARLLNLVGATYYQQRNYENAATHYFSALKIHEELGDKSGMARCHFNFALLKFNQGKYDESMKECNASLKIANEINDKQRVAGCYNFLARNELRKGNYSEVLANTFHALTVQKEIQDSRGMVDSYQQIGHAYFQLGKFSDAINGYLNALRIAEQIDYKVHIANGYNNVGNVYLHQYKFDEAIRNYEAAQKIKETIDDKRGLAIGYGSIGNAYLIQKKYADALKSYLASLALAKELKDKGMLATTYSNIGLVYEEQGSFAEALKNYQETINIASEDKNSFEVATALIASGQTNTKMNNYVEARRNLQEGLRLAKNIGSLSNLKEAYYGLSILDSATGNYETAYLHFKEFITYRDSLVNEDASEKIIRSQMQYDFDKKEDSLKYEQQITNEKLKQQILLARQQEQSLLLKAKEVALVSKEKDLQRLEYLRTQAELRAEQSKRKENEDQLIIAEQQKALQQTRLDLQATQLGLQTKELQARKTQRNIFIAGTIALLLLAFFIFRNFQNQRKANKLIKLSAAKERVELQLQSLRAQLNPHFMFNSLNAIQELIVMEENEKSQSYLERFAKLLRMLLENANEPFIPLRKEINFLELYLSLEKLRLPDLQYSIEMDPQIDLQKVMTPNMMLQPYVENALWHGLQHKQGEKNLHLHVGKQNGSLEYEIRDNGVGRNKAEQLKSLYRKEHRSKGMELLNQRFNLLSKEYGRNIETSVTDLTENGEASGTLVRITVPYSVEPIQKTVA